MTESVTRDGVSVNFVCFGKWFTWLYLARENCSNQTALQSKKRVAPKRSEYLEFSSDRNPKETECKIPAAWNSSPFPGIICWLGQTRFASNSVCMSLTSLSLVLTPSCVCLLEQIIRGQSESGIGNIKKSLYQASEAWD